MGGFAGEEAFRLGHEFGVVVRRDAADAGGAAAFDLVQQAGAGAVGEYGVGTGAEQEHALHGGDGLVDRPSAGEGAPVGAGTGLGAAVFGDLGERVVLGQHEPRVGFVVPQDDVEARAQALDEVGFEQQGLGLGVGGDDFHRHGVGHHAAQAFFQPPGLGVVGDAFFEAAGLADIERVAVGIEHAVDAGGLRQGGQHGLDHGHTLDGRRGRLGLGRFKRGLGFFSLLRCVNRWLRVGIGHWLYGGGVGPAAQGRLEWVDFGGRRLWISLWEELGAIAEALANSMLYDDFAILL